MLAGAGFGDQSGLAHALGQQCLADGVVDLVRAGMVQIFALKVDARAAQLPAPAFGVIERAGAADVMGQIGVQFRQEFGVVAAVPPGFVQFVQGFHQRFGHEPAAVTVEMTVGVGKLAEIDRVTQCGFHNRSHLEKMRASIWRP